MSLETVQAVVDWQQSFEGKQLDVTFHGGEPLMAGYDFYRRTLPILAAGLKRQNVRFSMQSNLWLLTDEFCELFRKYQVSLGTSLDGPEEINDAQRGRGYYRRTTAGIERARAHGLEVGCICTFTAQSAPRSDEIFDFFLNLGLNFSIHAALPSYRHPGVGDWALSPEEHGDLLETLLDRYLANLDRVRISTLDSLCRSVSARHGGICTFGDCLGGYLAVGPDGGIYPCQRFVGIPEFVLGNVHDRPTQATLEASPAWQMLRAREERIEEECGECPHLEICRGGCPYNALTTGAGIVRDPHCPTYQQIFDTITDRALEEVFSTENMEAVVDEPDTESALLRRGRLLSLMRNGPHPYHSAMNARYILAASALAEIGSPSGAVEKFKRLGLSDNPVFTLHGLEALHRRLTSPAEGLNNLYLHVTFACPLSCTHCYAEAGRGRGGETLLVDDVVRACREASVLGFRQVVITGGEPLVHPQCDALLDALAEIRTEIKPTLTVLRTSLALPLDDDLLRRLSDSTDQMAVSLDGDQETHDSRRGDGNYDRTVANLRALVARGCRTDLSLATVLPFQLATGPPGNSVRALARELGIRINFRPILPIGRAIESTLDIVPDTKWGHIDPREVAGFGFSPTASCGMGQNLYVEPDGVAFPCYAWHGDRWRLGDITAPAGLGGVVNSAAFQDLRNHTVDTNRRCRGCHLRYLCGGACRAWARTAPDQQEDLDEPPADCTHLRQRAESLLTGALEHLGVPVNSWFAV
jgi:uncharacterized protein